MTKGSKYEFLIPASLAYGDRGVSGVIPAGSPLFFEVELIDVRPFKALLERRARLRGFLLYYPQGC